MKKLFTATFERSIEVNGKFRTTKMKRRVRATTFSDALSRLRKFWGYEISNIQILAPKVQKPFLFFWKKK